MASRAQKPPQTTKNLCLLLATALECSSALQDFEVNLRAEIGNVPAHTRAKWPRVILSASFYPLLRSSDLLVFLVVVFVLILFPKPRLRPRHTCVHTRFNSINRHSSDTRRAVTPAFDKAISFTVINFTDRRHASQPASPLLGSKSELWSVGDGIKISNILLSGVAEKKKKTGDKSMPLPPRAPRQTRSRLKI